MSSTTRQAIRDALATAKPKREVITIEGQQIEISQPYTGDVVGGQKLDMISALIKYGYVPGTDELVFSEEDREWLAKVPWTKDWGDAVEALSKLMGLSVEDAKKNSLKTPTGTPS
jgi:hypothetical protein